LRQSFEYESRDGRAAEVAGWSNALAAIAMGGAVVWQHGTWAAAGATILVAFLALRLALTNRVTVWLAAAVGTLTVGGATGALAWLFGHVAELAWVPPIAGLVVGVAAAALPAWAYTQIARQRLADVPDSLLEPTRPSRPSQS
jgi:hypothetical protein